MTVFKIVTCQVNKNQQQDFSTSQLSWRQLSQCEGFGGQFGGWSQPDEQAIVVGVWQSQEHVAAFMESVHDKIFLKSGQRDTYTNCDVEYFEKFIDIPSSCDKYEIESDSVFRIAYCRGVQDIERLVADQHNVWNVHMGQAAGMLGGCVLRSLKQRNDFVVLTHWSSRGHHENYRNVIFPKLKLQLSLDEYIGGLSGCIVLQENAWIVAPNKMFTSAAALGDFLQSDGC